jgi:hypothetical protein
MPGKYYIYIPFASNDTGGNAELVKAAEEWGSKRIKYNSLQDPASHEVTNLKRKVPTVLVRGSKAKVLSVLEDLNPNQYTLYIMAHCNEGRDTVFNIQGVYDQDRTTLTATQLVQRLIEDGLPFNVMNLKLFACLGGTPSDKDVAFGEKLYQQLVGRGLFFMKLTAYQEALIATTVNPQTGHKQTKSKKQPSTVKKTWGPPVFTLSPAALEFMNKQPKQ